MRYISFNKYYLQHKQKAPRHQTGSYNLEVFENEPTFLK